MTACIARQCFGDGASARLRGERSGRPSAKAFR